MITLLCGENDYAIYEFLGERTAEFRQLHGKDSVETHSSQDISPDQLQDLLYGGSLFSTNRLVVIHNPLANKELGALLLAAVTGGATKSDVYIVEPQPDKRLAWYKALQESGNVILFDILPQRKLAAWIVAYVQHRQGEISERDAHYLIERSGTNQWSIKNELDKLLLYNNGVVSRQAIDVLVEPSVDETVFNLIDAVCRAQTEKAHDLYTYLSKREIDAQQFIALMAWQVNAMLVVKLNDRKSSSEIARAAAISPFVVTKTQGLIRQLSRQQILNIADAVLRADRNIKQTRADAESIVRVLIQQIAAIISS